MNTAQGLPWLQNAITFLITRIIGIPGLLLLILTNGVVYLDRLSNARYCISQPANGCTSYTHILSQQYVHIVRSLWFHLFQTNLQWKVLGHSGSSQGSHPLLLRHSVEVEHLDNLLYILFQNNWSAFPRGPFPRNNIFKRTLKVIGWNIFENNSKLIGYNFFWTSEKV